MNRGFLKSTSTAVQSKTRSGKSFSAPLLDNNHFPTLSSTGEQSSHVAQSPYKFKIPQFILDLENGNKNHLADQAQAFAPAVRSPEYNPSDVVDTGNTADIMGTKSSTLGVSQMGMSPVCVAPAAGLACEQPKIVWSSLFQRKPANAGRYTTKNFSTTCVNDVFVPPIEVIEAGKAFWKDYLVGFFLDKNLPYNVVKNHLLRVWKLTGTFGMVYDKDLYFFKFSCLDDRARVLESDPFIIMDKTFIVTSWSPTIDSVREQVRSIRVWVKFSSIPTMYQPLEGLDWLTGQIGTLICFDHTTERRDRLEYAIALIEITPDKLLPTSLSVYLSPQSSGNVDVSYRWKPPICTVCTSFGHIAMDCLHSGKTVDTPSVPQCMPILKPAPRVWRVKQVVAPLVTPLEHVAPVSSSGLVSTIKHDSLPDPNASIPNSSLSDDDLAGPAASSHADAPTVTRTSSLGSAAASVAIFAPDISSRVGLDASREVVGPMTQLLKSFVPTAVITTIHDPTSDIDFDHGEVYSIADIIPPHLFSDD